VGGSGKTRLALEAAGTLRYDFPDGVFLVDLAPLRDASLTAGQIARTLGMSEASGRPPAETLREYLRDKQMLLLLDNFEHLPAAVGLVSDLLASAGRLKVLATSREPLHLRGEHEFPVPPLELPDLNDHLPAETLSAYSAVALFVERTQASVADFALTEHNAQEVAKICARVDCLPLAIELVAARVRRFPPKTLLAKLEGAWGHEAFRLLGDGARDLPERHKTLQAAIGWSYDLLDKQEQTLFVRLSVFVGGCTPPAIEAVCRPVADPGSDAPYSMSSLLDKSLLKRGQEEGSDEETRFYLLETVREYAVSQLERCGADETAGVKRRHAEYFLALAEAAESQASSDDQQAWFRRLALDHSNIYAALDWLLEQGEAEQAARLAGAMGNFWIRHTHPEAIGRLLMVLEQRPLISPNVRSKVLHAACSLAVGAGDLPRAQALAEENLEVARSLGDAQSMMWAFHQLGKVAEEAGHSVQAESFFEEGLRLAQEVGDILAEARITNHLGETARALGDYPKAKALYEEGLRLAQEAGVKWLIAVVLHNLGKVALAMGNPAEAAVWLRQSLPLFHDLGSKGGAAYCLTGLGEAAAQQDTPAHAVTLLGAADALLTVTGIVLERVEHAGRDSALSQARARLAPDAFQAAWDAGRRMTLEQAASYALGEPATAA